jgi:hypothetical protein
MYIEADARDDAETPEQLVERMNMMIRQGYLVLVKWTCPKCGERVESGEPLADLPATTIPDDEIVRNLQAQVRDLTSDLDRATKDRDEYREIASEAVELIPHSVPPEARVERELPPPPEGPTPHAPSDAPSLPGPIMPETPPAKPIPSAPPAPPRPERPSKGYIVHPAVPAPAGEPGDADEMIEPLPTRTPGGWVNFTSTEIDLYSLEVLARRMAVTEDAPGLSITRRGLKDYKALSSHNKKAVLDALQFLSLAPQNLRETKLRDVVGEPLYSLRATRKLRIITSKPHARFYSIERIVDRNDKAFYRTER